MQHLPALLQAVIRHARSIDIRLDDVDHSAWWHRPYSDDEIAADPRLAATLEAALDYVLPRACEMAMSGIGDEPIVITDHIDPYDPREPWPPAGGEP
jgi:hypothetical protein